MLLFLCGKFYDLKIYWHQRNSSVWLTATVAPPSAGNHVDRSRWSRSRHYSSHRQRYAGPYLLHLLVYLHKLHNTFINKLTGGPQVLLRQSPLPKRSGVDPLGTEEPVKVIRSPGTISSSNISPCQKKIYFHLFKRTISWAWHNFLAKNSHLDHSGNDYEEIGLLLTCPVFHQFYVCWFLPGIRLITIRQRRWVWAQRPLKKNKFQRIHGTWTPSSWGPCEPAATTTTAGKTKRQRPNGRPSIRWKYYADGRAPKTR